MTTSLLFGFLGVVALMLFWVLVQNMWRRMFADVISDEDVLAERRSCGDCGCGGGVCKVGSRPDFAEASSAERSRPPSPVGFGG